MRKIHTTFHGALWVLFMFVAASYAQTFVSENTADLLVITHSQLRSPNWVPGMPNTWETDLLQQKTAQGLRTAIWAIDDDLTFNDIRNHIQLARGTIRYILILGDARRPHNSPDWPYDVLPMTTPLTDFASGNIVPIYRFTLPNPNYWPPAYENILESDQKYVENAPEITIGRVPAATRTEIRNYIAKVGRFLSDPDPRWRDRVLELLEDQSSLYNLCSGKITQDWTYAAEQKYPVGCAIDRLATSAGPQNLSDRVALFQTQMNTTTPGFIHVLGTGSRTDDLVNWYQGNSPYSFSNVYHLPFAVAISCDIGGFDQYDTQGNEIPCVLEKLLLLPNGGIIGAVTNTGLTVQTIVGLYTRNVWQTIFSENVRNFGQIVKRSLEVTENQIPTENFVLREVQLLGDPTLSLPFNTTWNAAQSPIYVTAPMTVVAGQTLTIEAGTHVLFAPGAYLTIAPSALLRIEGSVNNHVVLDCSVPGQRWPGLIINSNNYQNLIQYAELRHANNGAVARDAYVKLSHVTATECGNGFGAVRSSGMVEYSTLTNNTNRGLILVHSRFTVRGNGIDNNTNAGIRLLQSPYTNLTDNEIVSNGVATGFYGYWPGIDMLGSTASLSRNRIFENAGPGLTLFSQAYADLECNVFMDNMQDLSTIGYDFGQVFCAGGQPNIDCKLNTFLDQSNTHWLIHSQYSNIPAPGWDASWNYWGTTDPQNILPRLSNSPDIDPVLSDIWDCENLQIPICATDPEDELFSLAWQTERTAQFEAASNSYKQYLDEYPGGKYEKECLDRLMFCLDAQNWAWPDIRAYFQALAEDSSKDSTVMILAKSNAAWCLIEMKDFDGAYAELDSLLDQTDKDYLQLTLSLKQLLSDLEKEGLEIDVMTDNGQNRGFGDAIRSAAFVSKFEYVNSQVDSLVMAYLHGQTRPTTSELVPGRYALHQNYPNPFNPNTEIRFDLPEDIRIELKVFNTLGQLVTTLADEVRPAGAHAITWNGTSQSGAPVSSGLYIYQLKAGNFVSSRKMILLR